MTANEFQRYGRGGMVLLELIIALTIFAMVSVGLVTALDRAFDAAGDRRDADNATRGLQNQLVLLHGQRLIQGEQDLPDEPNGISYHVSVGPEPMLDQAKLPILGLYRATITAHWKSGGSMENQTVTTLIYQP